MSEARPQRWWPPHRVPEPHERIALSCRHCGIAWWIHRDLGGFRLRCECGGWLDVAPAAPPPAEAPPAHPDMAPVPPSQPASASAVEVDSAFDPVRSRPDHDLRHADVRARQRWTDRTLLELGAMMAAFLGPAVALRLLTYGDQRALLMPLCGLASGVLVLLIGATAAGLTFGAVRRAPLRYFAEALAVAGGAFALAVGWVDLLGYAAPDAWSWSDALRERSGLPATLFVLAFCPAVFEELAFRGLLQARLSMLLGARLGIVATGGAFALAHGATPALPLHLGLGVYLCWLRWRCGSVVPGMLLHGVYNTAVVLAL